MADALPASKKGEPGVASELTRRSDAWTDLALTLPIFLAYHLGVVFLPVRNAADPVTAQLRALADHSLLTYSGITLAVGAAFVAILLLVGERKALQAKRFLFIAVEGALYAFLMRGVASYAAASLSSVALPLAAGSGEGYGVFPGLVMSLGAGFYEEIAFRVGLFGLGALLIRRLFGKNLRGVLITIGWGVVSAAVFSGWHYVGAMGDPFDMRSFVFRAVAGMVLTAIYAFRGFAPAVWTHALYDVWALVLR